MSGFTLLDAPTVADSTGSPTSALKARRSKFKTVWSMPTTSASAEPLVCIKVPRAQLAIAAPPPKFRTRSNACWDAILRSANQEKICAASVASKEAAQIFDSTRSLAQAGGLGD